MVTPAPTDENGHAHGKSVGWYFNGMVYGTTRYMAPELRRLHHSKVRSMHICQEFKTCITCVYLYLPTVPVIRRPVVANPCCTFTLNLTLTPKSNPSPTSRELANARRWAPGSMAQR